LLAFGWTQSSAGEKKAKVQYQFVLPQTLNLQVGGAQDLELAMVPVDGFRVDLHGPLRIDVEVKEPSHVAIKKRHLTRKDALDSQSEAPRFRVPVRAKSAGQESLSIRYRFWLCRSKICHPIAGEAELSVDVAEAPAPDAGIVGPSPSVP
jgi:hypothetical protein